MTDTDFVECGIQISCKLIGYCKKTALLQILGKKEIINVAVILKDSGSQQYIIKDFNPKNASQI